MKPLFSDATLAKSADPKPTQQATSPSWDARTIDAPAYPVTPAPAVARNELSSVTPSAAPAVMRSGVMRPPSVTEEQVANIGARAATNVGGVTTELLSHLKASDSGDFGKSLNQLVVVAKGLSPDQMKSRGVIGRLTGLFASNKEKLMGQFKSVESQIDTLTTELASKAAVHRRRIGDLETLYNQNVKYHQELEAAEAECQRLLAKTQQEYDSQQHLAAQDSFGAQIVADFQRMITRLEQRIDNLKRAQMLAKQAAPKIRMMQEDTRSLVEKFADVNAVTLPAWKSAFGLYVLQLEQRRSVELLQTIDDATDAALRQSADLMRQNSADIATARNRSVVTLDTLSHVQTQLLGALDDVQRIDEEARQRRRSEATQLQALEQQLIDRFQPGQR